MMTVWFTADLHLGHEAIIRHCGRPFRSVAEMDHALVDAWNARVGPDDEVWILGDFAYRNVRSASSYLSQLRGWKHLVSGNHDSEVRNLPGWASSQLMAEIAANGQRLVLCHYAMRTWSGERRGAIHLYGHSHGRLPGDSQSCDVGVDVPYTGFGPVSLEEIRRHLATLPRRWNPEDNRA